jgi:hypothetical protein
MLPIATSMTSCGHMIDSPAPRQRTGCENATKCEVRRRADEDRSIHSNGTLLEATNGTLLKATYVQRAKGLFDEDARAIEGVVYRGGECTCSDLRNGKLIGPCGRAVKQKRTQLDRTVDIASLSDSHASLGATAEAQHSLG